MGVYSLTTHEYVHELAGGCEVLKENGSAEPVCDTSLEERVTRLEINSLYQRCTRQLVQIYEQEQAIPKLIGTVQDLVTVLSSHQQDEVSPTADTFGTEEAAKRLDCSPAAVRELAKSGKLPFIPQGKNFKFRQVDIDAYQDSETRSGADMRKNSRKRLSVQNDQHKIESKEKEEKKSQSEGVFPSTKEIKKLWQ
jgi:excisionase family DNA binding protein